MYCQNCGKEISKESKFCRFCGSKIQDEEVKVVETVKPISNEEKKEKLDGWLIIVFLGLCFATLITAYGAISTLNLFNDGTITLLNDSSSPVYSPSLSTAIVLELIGEAVFVGGAIYIGYLFFKRSKNFPKFYIWLLIYNVIFLAVDYYLVYSVSTSSPEVQANIDSSLTELGGQIGQALVSSLIWITYMLKSKKVKAVFIK